MSVVSSYVTVACCHKFFVVIEHLTILPKKENTARIFASVTEIGISVILIEFCGVNLPIGVCVRGKNVAFSILGSLSVMAFSASTRVVKPILTIFFVGSEGEFLTDAPMKERYSVPQNKSQAAFIFSLLDLPGRKVSAAQ